MVSLPRLVIATNNPGKVSEFRDLLSGCGWDIVSPAELGVAVDVDESGSTYAENARIKAEAFAKATGLAAVADDSGLEVDALGGEPGALHHLHGWDGRDNAERIQLLLDAMKDVPLEQRRARFRSVIVIVLPDGRVVEEEGVCEGLVTAEAVGDNGWGYDPVFLLPKRGVTMAQLSEAEKNQVSHRGIAAARIRERLRELARA
jgi:XTP/dITP diphosphohydrolase